MDRLSSRSPPLATSKCYSPVGFPYYYTRRYQDYRGWPYYLDPLDYPSLYYRRGRYWPYGYTYPYYLYSDYPYYYHRRPWLYYGTGYYSVDDYYGDYLRGYAEGMRKFDAEQRIRHGSGGGIGVKSSSWQRPTSSASYYTSSRYL